jgi:hypothetical protein
MKNCMSRACRAVALSALALTTLSTTLAFPAEPSKSTSGLSGIWQAGMPFDFVDPAKDEMPLTPAGKAKLKEWRDAADSGRPKADSVARCEAFGMPRVMTFGTFELLETPGQVTIITEILHEVRRIYTDGRKMPADFDASYDGYSTGHWEGKALVVTTTGLQANTNDQYGVPHTEHLKVLERIELLDNDTMRDRITLIDPEVYTKNWTVDRLYKRAKNYEISEYICNTNGAAIPPSGEVH